MGICLIFFSLEWDHIGVLGCFCKSSLFFLTGPWLLYDLLHSKCLQCLQFLMQFCYCNLATFALAKFARVVTKWINPINTEQRRESTESTSAKQTTGAVGFFYRKKVSKNTPHLLFTFFLYLPLSTNLNQIMLTNPFWRRTLVEKVWFPSANTSYL